MYLEPGLKRYTHFRDSLVGLSAANIRFTAGLSLYATAETESSPRSMILVKRARVYGGSLKFALGLVVGGHFHTRKFEDQCGHATREASNC